MEKLQDDTEDLEFKAQRHEEEAASLCAQNTQLVKKCSDLQRQLVECLSTVDVLDVRCNDAESKLDRARQALEVSSAQLTVSAFTLVCDLVRAASCGSFVGQLSSRGRYQGFRL